MDEPFSLRVAGPAWRCEAQDWIADQVTRSGGVVTGEIEQRRVRPWSTQLVAPTDRGPAWFKANCRALAFEPAVQQELSRLVPAEVDAPIALDTARGWMLTTDRGTTLGDGHEPTLDDWRAVVRLAATLQRRVADKGPTLRAAGLPDCAPATVPQRYAWLVDQLAALPADHPSHVGADEAATLRATVGRVEQAVEELLAMPLPVTFQHGDLHPKNVFAVDGGLRIFDFGDAQWAHALEVLAVPYGWVTQLTQLPWGLVLDAYAEVWSDVVSRDALEGLMPAAMVTHAVNRSFTWLGSVEGAQASELAEWGDAPVHYLRLAHVPFPPGASGEGA
ncbi:aminoglycoside phosphotransferase family protein [Nostocoides sp. HKS02]|uniref:aminoglycoside phosphotransferase family protein n=1 Tax=Nostocoides sp. HKS02 TaxID=1813880 RepID=UPI0012B4D376|nr:aminoglycoside phosphotransferase family protein [Tetrasphaera sp. HKS02]QGN57805.1 phosphotransferase [Tetrasphaera sp. HKS02]